MYLVVYLGDVGVKSLHTIHWYFTFLLLIVKVINHVTHK